MTNLEREGVSVPLTTQASGLALYDPRTGETYPVPTVTSKVGSAAILSGAVDSQGLQISAYIHFQSDGSLAVTGDVFDVTGADRVIDVEYTIPLKAVGGLWEASTLDSTAITAQTPTQSQTDLPFASVSGPGQRSALVCAIPPDYPGRFAITYDADEGLTIRLKFGLSPAASGLIQSRASFSFEFDVIASGWGIRAGLHRYYARHASWFADRVHRYGLWQTAPSDEYKSFVASRYAYHEAGVLRGGSTALTQLAKTDGWAADRQRGILTLPYLIPGQLSIPDSSKTLPGSYTEAIAAIHNSGAEPTTAHDASAAAMGSASLRDRALDCGIYNEHSQYVIDPRRIAPGEGEITVVVNPNPALYRESRQASLGTYLIHDYTHVVLGSPYVGGMYLDSLGGWGAYFNYRRQHFAYETVPLTYDDAVLKPAILNHVSLTEFAWTLRTYLHGRGKVLMGNDTGVQVSPPLTSSHKALPFITFALDIVAAEVTKAIGVPTNAAAYRCLAGAKPATFLVNDVWNDDDEDERDQVEKMAVLQNLFLASFATVSGSRSDGPPQPSEVRYQTRYVRTGQTLAKAGWRVVTGVRTGDPAVLVERYGSGGDAHLVFYNTADHGVTVHLSVDDSAPGFPRLRRVTSILSVDGDSLELQQALLHGGTARVAARQLTVLRLG